MRESFSDQRDDAYLLDGRSRKATSGKMSKAWTFGLSPELAALVWI
jgi:hypothetical protein